MASSRTRSLGVLVMIALAVLLVVVDMKRRAAESQLTQLSIRLNQVTGGNQEQNKEAARLVVQKVRRLIDIPDTPEPTVATIVDVEALKSKNAFYAKAKNGDHLIVTTQRAILYDPVADRIIDVVPVQVQAPADGAETNDQQ